MRKHRAQHRACAPRRWTGPDLECASDLSQPGSHRGNPDARQYRPDARARLVNRHAATIVADHEPEMTVGRFKDNLHFRCFGMTENVLTAVPYVPWYIGLIAAALILFLTPRTETKVRFHAAQGLAAHLGVLLITQLLFAFGGFASAIGVIFTIITSIMFIVWAIKAWRGRPVVIQSVEALTNWLEEKIFIKPKN